MVISNYENQKSEISSVSNRSTIKQKIQPQISRNSSNNKNSLLIKKISYSGELDDDKSDDDISNINIDDKSIRSYQPEISDYQDFLSKDSTNKFSRQISREDASSIIGGLNLQNSNLSNKNLSIKNLRFNESKKNISSTSLKNNLIQNIENNDDNYSDNNESKKVFNFSLPFSNPTNHEGEEGDEENKNLDTKSEVSSKIDYLKPIQTAPLPNSHYKNHHDIPIISKTFRKLSHFLPFTKKNKSSTLNERPILIRRSSHPEAPLPPSNVYVYWEDIAHRLVPDEMADRENVRLKLERQESLDTLQEARYYKDIRHLDDGKIKALRQSLLPHTPSLAISHSISSKISYVATRIKSDPSISPPPSQQQLSITSTIPEAHEKVINNSDKKGELVNSLISNNNGLNESSTSLTTSIASTLDKDSLSANNHNQNLSSNITSSRFLSSIPMSPISSITHHTDSTNSQIFDELDGDVLVIGGYRGSILRDSRTHRRTWIPVLKAGLNIRKINLVLGPKDEDELRELNARDIIFDKNSKIKPNDKDYPDIYPDGMLTHIGPVDISRRLIKKLNSNPRVNAKDWGYDWRLSPELISKQLNLELSRIVSNQKIKKGVILIAHSMGGIIAHGAMVLNPKLVRGIVYAGTPMPCANILGPLRFSDAILLSHDVLTHEANFFMRSSFVFLPPSWGGEDENGKNGGMCLYRDLRNGKRYKIDFWDEKNWVYYNLSPLVSSVRLKHEVANGKFNIHKIKDENLKIQIKKFLKIKINPETELIVLDEISRLHEPVVSWLDSYIYLSKTLKRTKKFLKSLERKDNIIYPPMSQIFSNGVPSVKYSLVDGEEGIKRGEYYRFFYGPGDGVVYQGWNFPRERGRKRLEGPDCCGKDSVDRVGDSPDWRGREYGYGEKYSFDLCGRIRSTSGHIALLVDLDLVGQALSAIINEERRRILEN